MTPEEREAFKPEPASRLPPLWLTGALMAAGDRTRSGGHRHPQEEAEALMAGKRVGRGRGTPCAALLATGPTATPRALEDSKWCQFDSQKRAEQLADEYQRLDESELMKITLVLPAIAASGGCERQQVHRGISVYFRWRGSGFC